MNLGVVLKSYFPQKNKILLFDKYLGKISVSVANHNKDPRLTNGMIISRYIIDNSKKFNIIKNFEIIEYPISWYSDIYFLHHVLELYQYCTPKEAVCNELFELIYFLCSSFDKFKSINSKKIFLYKFFLILGIYPSDNDFYCHKLAIYSIDKAINIKIDLDNEKKISNWLFKCIKLFNVKSFLNELIYNENIEDFSNTHF